MTCTSREAHLALYVESDLPGDEVLALEAHLAACEDCRRLLADLRESQQAVRALAAEPMAEETLAAVRSAVRQRTATEGRPRPWRWAAAAALAALAVGGSWLWWRAPATPIARSTPTSAPSAPEVTAGPPQPHVPPRADSGARSTHRAARAVSPDVARPTTAATLTREDADQLARAVVALSRIERVTDNDREADSPSTWVRLTTDDPKVVIYWQLDSNGGT